MKGFATDAAFPYVGWELIPMTFDQAEEAATMTRAEHPDTETLERFVLGRLDRRTMATVERHLRDCSECGQAAMQVPDDRLVSLLRGSTSGPATESSPCDAACSRDIDSRSDSKCVPPRDCLETWEGSSC